MKRMIKNDSIIVIALLTSFQICGMASPNEFQQLIEKSAQACRLAIRKFDYTKFQTHFDILKQHNHHETFDVLMIRAQQRYADANITPNNYRLKQMGKSFRPFLESVLLLPIGMICVKDLYQGNLKKDEDKIVVGIVAAICLKFGYDSLKRLATRFCRFCNAPRTIRDRKTNAENIVDQIMSEVKTDQNKVPKKKNYV